jgi:hypothetical protein
LSEAGEFARCPVCRARFRGSAICSRCGANLEPLMTLVARAYRFRNLAAQALQQGNYQQAERFAAQAQAYCNTRRGQDLERLSAWLLHESVRDTSACPPDDSTVTSQRRLPPERAKLTRPRREGQAAIYYLILAGIVGLGWAATAAALRRLKGSSK